MSEVWDEHWFGSTKTLDTHIAWLRRKLGDDPDHPRWISTVRGVGLRFEPGDSADRRWSEPGVSGAEEPPAGEPAAEEPTGRRRRLGRGSVSARRRILATTVSVALVAVDRAGRAARLPVGRSSCGTTPAASCSARPTWCWWRWRRSWPRAASSTRHADRTGRDRPADRGDAGGRPAGRAQRGRPHDGHAERRHRPTTEATGCRVSRAADPVNDRMREAVGVVLGVSADRPAERGRLRGRSEAAASAQPLAAWPSTPAASAPGR